MKLKGMLQLVVGMGLALGSLEASANGTSGAPHGREGFIPNHVFSDLMRSPDAQHRIAGAQGMRGLQIVRVQLVRAEQARRLARRNGRRAGGSPRFISDAGGTRKLPGTMVVQEGQPIPANAHPHVAIVHAQAGELTAFAHAVMHRDGVDNAGGPLHFTVNYADENAYFMPDANGGRMVTGIGRTVFKPNAFVTKGVASHELGHKYIDGTSDLEYRNESGALNESFADIIASVEEQHTLGQTVDQAHWLIGPGIWAVAGPQNIALRSMKEPGKAYDLGSSGRDRQVGHYSNLYKGSSDNGGVHWNSGIPNHMFYRFATGLASSSPSYSHSTQVAWPVFQAANETYLTKSSNIHDLANAAYRIAVEAPEFKNDPAIARNVVEAAAAVGVQVNVRAAMALRPSGRHIPVELRKAVSFGKVDYAPLTS